MTFNIRQPDQDDGPHCWEARKDALVETIVASDPDAIGTQELFMLQADYILARAPQYAWFGSGRFGDHQDKHVAIFYRKDRLRLSSHADFWLSETPDTPGSSSWDIIRPRQLTWGAFESDGLGRFTLFNTHFPYRAVEEEARRRTAQLVKARVAAEAPSGPAIVTADFNAPAGGEIHRLMLSDFRDAWTEAQTRSGPEGTLNGFGRATSSRRIDWILFRGALRVLDAETVAERPDGRYPSDHFPVVATFENAGC